MRNIFSLLLKELRPHVRSLVAYAALALVAAGLEAVSPMVLGRAVDTAIDGATVTVVLVGIGAWWGMRALAEACRSTVMAKGDLLGMEISERFVQNAIMQVIDKPLAHHHDARQREHANTVMRFRHQLHNLVESLPFDILPAFATLLAMLVVISLRAPSIAAVLATAVGSYVAYVRHIIPERLRTLKATNKKQGEAADLAWDAVGNVMTVKSCANEVYVGQALDRKFVELRSAFLVMVALFKKMVLTENLIIVTGSGAAVALAAMKLQAGVFTPGDFSAIVAYTFAAFGYIRGIAWQYRNLLEATASYDAIREILAVPAEDFVSGEACELGGAVDFQGVRFRYREDKQVLEDVSFSVPAGSRVALVGRSGEGKTTIVDLLGRYYAPTDGEIRFDGIPASACNLRSLRSQMAYVPQETTLFHETLGYNVRFGRPDATDEEVDRALRFAKLDTFVQGLPEGLATAVGEKGLKLSGGQRQRVSLARAFLRNPKILVLDEPTSQLDAETESDIQRSLAELMKGRTTFIIAHRLRTVKDADQILVLVGGRIIERGTHAELAAKTDGTYLKLLRAQGMVAEEAG